MEEILKQVRLVYEEWQARPLQRNCTGLADCCRFRLAGHTPYLTRGEALLAAKAWKASGRSGIPDPADESCPFHHPKSGKCGIYQDRPFGCRTHFCAAAGGPAKRGEVRDLIQRLEDIDTALGGDGPVSLRVAIRWAMKPLSRR